LVAAAVVWQTTRVGNKLRVPTPALVVPTMLALGSVVVGWLPAVLNPQTDAGWLAVPIATACWWPVVTVVASRAQRLFERGRTAAARKLLIVGTAVALPLPWVVYLTILASDPGLTGWGDFGGFRGFGSLPALLTIGTPFAFALLSGARPRQPA
jgi:hypothetical protein